MISHLPQSAWQDENGSYEIFMIPNFLKKQTI